MSLDLTTPTAADLHRIADVLSSWQVDDGPLHLHPGDLGWHSMRGATGTSAALRVWSDGGDLAAIGLLDGPDGLLRMAVDPRRRYDPHLAQQVADDVGDPGRGVLEEGEAIVEARGFDALALVLSERGWQPDEPWTPLHRDLRTEVDLAGTQHLRIETIGEESVDDWVSVHWSAFKGTPLDGEKLAEIRDWWLTMARGPFYDRARSLVAFDGDDAPVAVTTVWSAGEGRPGLLEPMGVHRDHRGRGYGVAISVAAAATLRDMGASSAIVCAENANAGALATYLGAGFTAHDAVVDLARGA